jgi:tetratricopeptide (TPR) repeat protein
MARGDITGAEASFSKAIEFNENYAEAYIHRGLVRWYLSRFGDAMRDYNRALILNNGLSKAYHNRGNIKVLLNDLTSAREDYDMGISLNGNLEKTYFNRGVLRFLMGNPEEGCRDLWESRGLGYDEAIDKTDKYCQ